MCSAGGVGRGEAKSALEGGACEQMLITAGVKSTACGKVQ